jgi:DNA-binding LacI/PurR family transcriptional regulator
MSMDRRQQVIDHLLGKIADGKLREGVRIPSEQSLAQRMGVNKTTANKAVACLVERGILERRRGAAGTVVRRVPAHPCGAIAFLLDLSIAYQAHLLRAAETAAFARGYALQFLQRSNIDGTADFWERIAASGLRGMLVCSHTVEPPPLPFPVLFVDAVPRSVPGANWVLSDDFRGGYLLGKHLMEEGHRDVVFISGNPPLENNLHQRVDGFVKALKEYRVRQIDKRLMTLWTGQQRLFPLMELAFKQFPALSAVAFDRDLLAEQAMAYCQQHGIRVPQDLSVAGYGAVDEYYPRTSITSIEQHPFQLSVHATNRLLDLAEGRCDPPVQETLPVEFIRGHTTAAAPHRRTKPQRQKGRGVRGI